MKISCPNCSAAYELDDSRVPPAGLSIKCPKCKNPFTVHRKGGEAAKPGAPKGAVPLPGQAGAKPAGAKAGARKPGQKAAGAVPLPGLGEGAPQSAPRAAAPAAGAVPLPGLDPDMPAPPPAPAGAEAEGAVPLPGFGEGKAAGNTRPPPSAPDLGAVALPGLDDPMPAPRAPAAPVDPFANLDLGAPAPPKAPAPPPSAPPKTAELDEIFSVDTKSGAPKPQAKAPAVIDDAAFDFVQAPPRSGAPRGGDGPDMLDFVDEKTALTPKDGKKDKKRPPPQARPEEKEETLSFGEAFGDVPAAPAPPAKEAKKAEKERKKQEKADKAAREREERDRRKIQRGPGAAPSAVRAVVSPKLVAAIVLLAGIGVGVWMGLRARSTPAGLFWMNKFVPSKKAATAAESKVIDKGLQKLAQGDFAGAREAVASAAQLIGVLPDDDEVKAFFVLAASELKLEYGQVGGDWDHARRLVDKVKGSRPSQARAHGAFALADGDFAGGKQALAAVGEGASADLESIWLYAKALLLSGEQARAAQVLDNALKSRGGAVKLLLLRASIARDKGQLPEAAALFQKALVASPDNGRALVELAAVRLRQRENKIAGDFLAKALDTEVRKTLDAGEEARANMLRGTLAAATHDNKAAEAAYDRAVSLDPNSGAVREAYGEFRLARREWEKSARQFEAAIAAGTASAAAHAGAARAYLGLNRLLEADKAINQAAAKDPNDAHVIYLQGRVAEAIGKGDEAFKRYEAALQKKPDLVEALAAEGVVYFNRLDKAKAKERLEAALKVPEEKISALEDEAVGNLALLLGDKRGAKAAYQRALEKDSADPLAHAGMGKALAAEGDLAGARKELELAIAQVDSDASIQFEYGSLLRRLGQSDAALEALRKAVKLDSKDPRYRARLGALLVERGQFEEAEQQLRQAVLMNDRYAEGLYNLARALAGRKSLSEAVDTMKKAVEIDPDNGEYLYQLGMIYEQGQQVQDSVDAFTRALAKDPKNAGAHEHLGINLMVENRFPEAAASFRKAAELEPKRARLWAELGDAEQQYGDLDAAIRDLQKALALDSHLVGVWTKLGIAYKDKDCRGCRTKALDALKRAAQVDPADALAHHELGYMYKDDNRRREAIAEFRRYLELRPDAGDLDTVQDDIYYLQEESRRTP